MAEAGIQEIQATVRPAAGKGASRAVRREGKVPAVIYGDKKTPETIAIDFNEVVRLINRGVFLSHVFDITFDGRTIRALTREV
ncbi:MAG: 50S ribosomal protein L25, partial [Pseudomonadota bacterium]